VLDDDAVSVHRTLSRDTLNVNRWCSAASSLGTRSPGALLRNLLILLPNPTFLPGLGLPRVYPSGQWGWLARQADAPELKRACMRFMYMLIWGCSDGLMCVLTQGS